MPAALASPLFLGGGDWQASGDIADLELSPAGLSAVMTGPDPHVTSPLIRQASPVPVRVRFRMRSTGDGAGRVIAIAPDGSRQAVDVRVRHDGRWHEHALRLPPMVAGSRLRIDPSQAPGTLEIAQLDIQPLAGFRFPTESPVPVGGPPSGPRSEVGSGELVFSQGAGRFGDYRIRVGGQQMAASWPAERIGYLAGDEPRWLLLGDARPRITRLEAGLRIAVRLRDGDGGTWTVRRDLTPGKVPGTLDLRVEVRCDHERAILHLPWLTLLAGLDGFGTRKHQALLAGVEYLADEPSSSEADLAPPWNDRLAPHPAKLTIPLMALEHGGRFMALAWQPSGAVSPVFDSPDRVFLTRSHLMALSGPAVGPHRAENALVAHTPIRLAAGEPLRLEARILGGHSPSVTGAVRLWARDFRWPEAATPGLDAEAAIRLMALGWLDSAAHRDGTWEHALGRGHQPHPPAQVYLDWLAQLTEEPTLRERLVRAMQRARERLPNPRALPAQIGETGIPALTGPFDRIPARLAHTAKAAERRLSELGADGLRRYQREPGALDYGRTHFADHANGYGAHELARILAAAALTGDEALRQRALDLLDRQDAAYRHGVPRGAQTWEVPLHTPDILAAARLIHAFVLGHEISGERRYLEAAVDWAWSGLPFVYLVPPGPGPIGAYATTPVLGASHWDAVNWIGKPVQWCGLVYADALLQLAPYDDSAPWGHIARGIIAAGLAMTHPEGSGPLVGLLPDFFRLEDQYRDPFSIIPSRVQHNLAELYGLPRIEHRRALPDAGLVVHAPGTIEGLFGRDHGAAFEIRIRPWSRRESLVVVSGPATSGREIRHCPAGPDAHTAACGPARELSVPMTPNARAVYIRGPTRILLGTDRP